VVGTVHKAMINKDGGNIMECIKNELCYKNTLFCCYSCKIICETRNNCNNEECKNNPNNIENKKEQYIIQESDIKWLLQELLEAGKYAEVDFSKITEIAKRNGYEVDEDLDLVEIEQ